MHERSEHQDSITVVLPILLIVSLLGLPILLYYGQIEEATFIPFALTVAAIVYFLTFVDIRVGLAVLFLCVGLSPEMTIAGIPNIRMEDLVVPALFAAWITRLIERKEEFAPSGLKGPILLYLFTAVISSLVALAGREVTPSLCFLVFGKTVEYFVIYMIVLNNIKTDRDAKGFIVIAIIVSSIAALTTAVSIQEVRVMGPFGETGNIFGGYLIMNIAVLIGLFLSLEQFKHRLLISIVISVLGYTLMFTYSRTSYAALAIGIAIFGLFKKRQLLIVLFCAAALFPLIAPEQVLNRAKTISSVLTENQDASWRARVSAWENSVDEVMTSPLFGKGLSKTNLGDVDNEYVRVVIDMGIIGLLAFIWLLVRIGKKSFSVTQAPPQDPMLRGFADGYQLAFISVLIYALGATAFSSIRTMETFMIMTAILGAISNIQKTQAESAPEPERTEPSLRSLVPQK